MHFFQNVTNIPIGQLGVVIEFDNGSKNDSNWMSDNMSGQSVSPANSKTSSSENPLLERFFSRFVLYGLFLCVQLFGNLTLAQYAAQSDDWHEGKKLTAALQTDLSIKWNEAPLKEELLKLGARYGVSIFLDRRINPNRIVSIDETRLTVEQLFHRIADQTQLGVSRIDNVIYFGPIKTAQQLPQWVSHWNALMKKQLGTRIAAKKDRLSWNRLDTPKEILGRISTQQNIRWNNLDKLPHDLWDAQSLPRLTLGSRLGLLLVGFELGFVPGKSEPWDIQPLAQLATKVDLNSSYVKLEVPGGTTRKFAELENRFPTLRIKRGGQAYSAAGPAEDISKLARFLVDRQAVKQSPLDLQRYDLANTTAARGAILASLAKQAGLKFTYGQESVQALQAQVTIDAFQKSVPELIEIVLQNSELTFKIEANELSISKK